MQKRLSAVTIKIVHKFCFLLMIFLMLFQDPTERLKKNCAHRLKKIVKIVHNIKLFRVQHSQLPKNCIF